jgi:hypothetical protein
MTTFEEDVIECHYNISDFFTMKNISVPATGKIKTKEIRPAGELDLLCVRISKNDIKERVRVESSVSVTGPFPYDEKEVVRFIKKFSSHEEIVNKYFGDKPYERIFIARFFRNDAKQKLEEWGKYKSLRIAKVDEINDGKELVATIRGRNKEFKVKIIQFHSLYEELIKSFLKRGLLLRNFTDPRKRGIQHHICEYLKDKIFDMIKEKKIKKAEIPRKIIDDLKVEGKVPEKTYEDLRHLINVLKGEKRID